MDYTKVSSDIIQSIGILTNVAEMRKNGDDPQILMLKLAKALVRLTSLPGGVNPGMQIAITEAIQQGLDIPQDEIRELIYKSNGGECRNLSASQLCAMFSMMCQRLLHDNTNADFNIIMQQIVQVLFHYYEKFFGKKETKELFQTFKLRTEIMQAKALAINERINEAKKGELN